MIANQVDAAEYARLTQQQQKPRKYRNEPITLDGWKFDSKAEATQYSVLRLCEMAGTIHDLRVHTRWPLVVNGVNVGAYVSDFDYLEDFDGGSDRVIEDVKAPPAYDRNGKLLYSGRTAVYRLKRRLMKALYGIEIREVNGSPA